jgi:hypothetical protein
MNAIARSACRQRRLRMGVTFHNLAQHGAPAVIFATT